MEQQTKQSLKHNNLLRRELAWLKRGAKARTTKQKARIQRVESLQEKEAVQANYELDFAVGSKRLGKNVIELKQVTKSYGHKRVINDFSYLLDNDERLGIIGENGTGKTTLLNLLSGRERADSGEVIIGETVSVGYYTQEDAELDGEMRVIDYIKEVAEVVHTRDNQVITAEQMLERFMFPRSMQWTYIRRLSGGEQRRLYLLRVLMEEPNVLFLDEPTNDLDIQTLTILEHYLEQFPGVVVTVSHDRYFLDRVVDRLLVFQGNGRVTRFYGHYSDYLQKQLEEAEKAAKGKAMEKRSKEQPLKKKKKLSYHEQKEWDGIEERIASLEQRREALVEQIAEAGSDYDTVSQLTSEQEQLEQELELALGRWEELALLVEELKQ